MFDINNQDLIMKLIQGRKVGSFVTPLYVRNYNEKYGITELNQIKNFNPSSFSVGFGVTVSVFDRFSFPQNMMHLLEPVTAFSKYNEDKNTNERFIVFEIGKDELPENDVTYQIWYYQDILFDYLSSIPQSRQSISELLKEYEV